MFSNWNEGTLTTAISNTQIDAKNNSFNFNVTDQVNTSYDSKLFDAASGVLASSGENTQDQNLNYLAYLYNNQTSLNTAFNPTNAQGKSWHDNTRGLTDAGTAVVAVAAVAATIASAGAAGVAVAGAAGATTAAAGATVTAATLTTAGSIIAASTAAVITTAATTAAVSATNSSMNADGSLFSQVKSVGHTTLKDTFSDESLKNMAIAGITAGIAEGLSQYSGVAEMSRASGAINTADGTRSAAQVLQDLKVSLYESAISNTASSVVQSAINGDSTSNTLGNLALNIAIGAVGNAAAKEIGNAAHPTKTTVLTDSNGNVVRDLNGNALTLTIKLDPTITTTQQLALHGALGCAMASAGGNNCAAGAAAGIIGEAVGAAVYQDGKGLSRDTTVALSQISGALAAGMIAGPDDGNSVFAGGLIGYNAAKNNAVQVWVQEVAAGNYHTSTKITPENQEKYASDVRFQNIDENGNRYATLGGGPDNFEMQNVFQDGLGNLIGGVNRNRDIDLGIKVYISENLVPQSVEDKYIQQLFRSNENYNNNLKYNLFPVKGSSVGYNSNSYTAGLLNSVGITPPMLPNQTINYQYSDWEYNNIGSVNLQYILPKYTAPGYNKPVPIQYFE